AAITDPGTDLEREARDRGFRALFHAPEDVGGRFSALTVFGLVPAALCGVDPELLLTSAAEAFARCLPEVPVGENPAAVLGAAIGEAALAGRDKLTLHAPEELAPFGAWLEQLIAESTGKQGRGILPVVGEPRTEELGNDRLVVAMGEPAGLAPAVEVSFDRAADLGGLFFVWELATAIAGGILGITPFDQPNVQEAKDRTTAVLQRGVAGDVQRGSLDDLLHGLRPWDYVAIQAYVDPKPEIHEQLQAVRGRILDKTGVTTTLGFGPRYLHSTGQLHKGGPPSGVFVQVFDPPTRDRAIPGRDLSFGDLIAAQAAGDLESLRALGRRVARVAMEDLLTWPG
ncbi:MAG TPA: glucose-6-phosphate isomerase, partial [Actinomycetota bacterium]|nr:glucose-6-phosphate isomerase [Actinomycetota bacterium]